MTTTMKLIADLWDEIEARPGHRDTSTERLFALVESEASVILRRKVSVSEVTRALEARERQRASRGAP